MSVLKVLFFLALCLCLGVSLSTSSVLLRDTETTALAGMSSDPNDIEFHLYPNPSNVGDSDKLIFNDINSIKNSRFDTTKRTIFYSSGFLQNRTSDQAIKDAYLRAGFGSSSNIIVIDWGKLSGNTSPIPEFFAELHIAALYNAAKNNAEVVGRRLQEMISFLIENGQISGADKIHIVGQSLGAHVAGFAGLYIRQETGKMIGRITGTDAAAQLFQGVHIDKRLDASDAIFVDAIHTNEGGYGYSGPFATADFFVNGGKAPQPGCDGTESFCSHNMAVTFFAKSIMDQSLRACETNVCAEGTGTVQFGQYCPTSVKGSFYINTTPDY